jgi:hypothetical protein
MNVAIAVLGGLIALFSFLSGIAIYDAAKSAIHEIYAALLMITSVLGLVILAIGVGAATIRRVIHDGEQQASSERQRCARAIGRGTRRAGEQSGRGKGLRSIAAHCPVSTMSISRLPQCEHQSLSRQSSTDTPAPYRAAISAGPGSA